MSKLSGVSETLLFTLYFRYLETKKPDGIFRDEKAVEIVENLDEDLSKFANDELSQLGLAIRSEIIDEQTKAFLKRQPQTKIINIAAGLCTRFFRVDNGKIEWYALDLEQVKPIWEKLIGETERLKYLCYSALDFAWMEHFRNCQNEKLLFIIEGLSMYLTEAEVKQLIIGIKNNFPSAEILIDAVNLDMVDTLQYSISVSKTKAKFIWGIDSWRELEKWDQDIKLVNEWYYRDRHIERWKIIDAQNAKAIKLRASLGHIKFGV